MILFLAAIAYVTISLLVVVAIDFAICRRISLRPSLSRPGFKPKTLSKL